MPHIESLSLFKIEESNEEAAAFASLVTVAAKSSQPECLEEDVAMEDIDPTATASVTAAEQQQSPAIGPQETSKVTSQYKTQTQQDLEPYPIVLTTTAAPSISNFGEVKSQAGPESMHPKPLPQFVPASPAGGGGGGDAHHQYELRLGNRGRYLTLILRWIYFMSGQDFKCGYVSYMVLYLPSTKSSSSVSFCDIFCSPLPDLLSALNQDTAFSRLYIKQTLPRNASATELSGSNDFACSK
jgi:hypothetical protein